MMRQLGRVLRRISDIEWCIQERRWIVMGKGAYMRALKKASRRALRRASKFLIAEQCDRVHHEGM